jgi:hypothetical protein
MQQEHNGRACVARSIRAGQNFWSTTTVTEIAELLCYGASEPEEPRQTETRRSASAPMEEEPKPFRPGEAAFFFATSRVFRLRRRSLCGGALSKGLYDAIEGTNFFPHTIHLYYNYLKPRFWASFYALRDAHSG